MAIAALPSGKSPFAVLRIGMDDFRLVNDTFGIAIGDEVLDLAGKRLQAAVREQEFVVRLPGDEFAVLLHPMDSVIRAGAAADRLSDLLQRVYLVEGEVVNVTACLGVALAPEDGTDAEVLLQRAGAALQCAKAAGTGMVQFFEPAMEENRKKRHSLSLDLRKALLLHQFRGSLPAPGGCAHGSFDRLRGAAALAPSGSGMDSSRRVHSVGRGNRADGHDRRLGVEDGV